MLNFTVESAVYISVEFIRIILQRQPKPSLSMVLLDFSIHA